MDAIKALLDWIALIGGLAAVLVAPTTATVAALKTVINGRLPSNYYPALSVAVGALIGEATSLISPLSGYGWALVVAGAVAGYSASALYAAAAERDTAKAAALKPSPAIIGIPTVPTSPTPHPIDTYLRPMVFSSPGTTPEQVAPHG